MKSPIVSLQQNLESCVRKILIVEDIIDTAATMRKGLKAISK